MIEKSLFYWAGLYHNGLKKNQEYEENRKAITINILNFNLVKEGPCHEIVELKRKYRNIKLTDKLEMHFIQLEKFKQEGMKEENRELWNWLTFICDKDKKEDKILDRMLLGQLLETLNPEERRLIYLRYFADKTQTDVGKLMGISQVQVSRLEKKILENMRKMSI